MYYGVDYYPEHWPKERWETDARLMHEAGINLVRLGEFAWALLEPQEGRYDFGWLDEAIDVLGRQGLSVILGTPTATPPAWLSARYPEILRYDRDGRPVTLGMRRQYCPTSPTYRALSQGIVTALAEHYASHPQVIGWQIDNEFGGDGSARCYCPACQRAFQDWVHRRYGTLAALNDAWGAAFWSHLYSSWSQIPLPWSTTGVMNPCLALDFERFSSDQFVAYQQLQIDILQTVCPEHSITTNLMGFGFQELDYFDLARPLDFVAWDNYPIGHADDPAMAALGHALMRGLKERPFWVMEQQAGPTGWQMMSPAPRPGQLRLWAYQAIAHGADAIVYFRWRTCPFNTEEYWHGVLDHDGRPRRRYAEVQRMGGEIARLGDQFVGAATPKAVAILFSYDDSWALRLQPGAPGIKYPDLVAQYYRAFHRLNIPVDVISPEADLSPYRLVVAPTLHVLPAAWAEKLGRYVEHGGQLVIGARSGVKDTSNRVVNLALPGLLAELCGIEIEEYDALGARLVNGIRFEAGEIVCTVDTWCEVLRPQGAEVVARYTQDYYAGQPAITKHAYVQGQVYYVGVIGQDELYAALADYLTTQAGLRPLLTVPKRIEVVARENRGATYLFVLNHTGEQQALDLPYPCRDLLTDTFHEGWMMISPYEVMVLVAAG